MLVLNSFSNTISQRLALNHSTLLQGVNYVRIREHGLPPSGEPVNIPAGFKIGIVIHTRNDGATRVNSIPNFMETNRRVSVHAYLYRLSDVSFSFFPQLLIHFLQIQKTGHSLIKRPQYQVM